MFITSDDLTFFLFAGNASKHSSTEEQIIAVWSNPFCMKPQLDAFETIIFAA